MINYNPTERDKRIRPLQSDTASDRVEMPFFGFCRDCGWWYISQTLYETEKEARTNASKHSDSKGHRGHRTFVQKLSRDQWVERMKNWDTKNYRNNDPHAELPPIDPVTGAFLAHSERCWSGSQGRILRWPREWKQWTNKQLYLLSWIPKR